MFHHLIIRYTVYIYNDGGSQEWQAWLLSFDWYLQANKIEDEHEKYVKLMHLAGQKIQGLYATLPIPEHVVSVRRGPLKTGYVPHLSEYEMAIEKLNDHFQPKKNSTYERYELRKLEQATDEKIAVFAMRLRKQAERCDLGDKLEEHVKDQLIGKYSSPTLRGKLLALGDANLDVVLRGAKAFEAVLEQSKALGDDKTDYVKEADVNKINVRPKLSQFGNDIGVECHRCGFTGHRQYDEKCPAKGKPCNKCGGLNHFSRKCRSKKRVRQVIEKTTQASKEPNTNVKSEENASQPKQTKVEETVKYVSDATGDNEYVFHIEHWS